MVSPVLPPMECVTVVKNEEDDATLSPASCDPSNVAAFPHACNIGEGSGSSVLSPLSTPLSAASETMSSTTPAAPILRRVFRLGAGPWTVPDPFLFCVHHLDRYPAGYKGSMGPDPLTHRGRDIGSDFSYRDGWSMYHGDVIPGFPQHPHRGFETITVTLQGLVDHSDSMGATARYGQGDVQWMTAGSGIQHSEMFPLIRDDAPNPAELFQLWLNLPKKSKMVKPHFAMFWEPDVPKLKLPSRDDRGHVIEGAPGATVTIVAGNPFPVDHAAPSTPSPPPDSWASQPGADVAVWIISLPAGTTILLPPSASRATNRALYVYAAANDKATVDVALGPSEAVDMRRTESVPYRHGAFLDRSDLWTALRTSADQGAEVLVLQGRPIGEPVAQHGPFVMNTQEEIMQAFTDYRATQFGGWPWPAPDHAHPATSGRFAAHADGKREEPERPATSDAAPDKVTTRS